MKQRFLPRSMPIWPRGRTETTRSSPMMCCNLPPQRRVTQIADDHAIIPSS